VIATPIARPAHRTRCAARSAIRRPPQLGHTALPLQENGTEAIEPAAVAAEPSEPTRKEPAAQEAPELLLDKPRQRVPLVDTRRLDAERFEMSANHLIPHGCAGDFGV
jgi:hypothetical protein